MSVIAWIILGLIAGFIGSKIVNKSGQGFLLDVALGVIGAVVGGVIFNFFGAAGVSGLNIYSLIGHLYKVLAYLLIYRVVFVSSVEEPYRRLAAEISERHAAEAKAEAPTGTAGSLSR